MPQNMDTIWTAWIAAAGLWAAAASLVALTLCAVGGLCCRCACRRSHTGGSRMAF